MGAPVRVVLDTNVVLSALVFGGGMAGRLRGAWQNSRLLPLVNTQTVQELIRVLSYPKFQLSRDEQAQLLADYLPYTETVVMPLLPPVVPDCRDPFDAIFMRLAVTGRASVLVSGDKDLLVLASEFEAVTHCPVLTLGALFEVYPELLP